MKLDGLYEINLTLEVMPFEFLELITLHKDFKEFFQVAKLWILTKTWLKLYLSRLKDTLIDAYWPSTVTFIRHYGGLLV